MMTDPIALDAASARFALPLLFAGQAQKEVFVNQALATLDGLVHCAIEGEQAAPPSAPVDGTAWLVAAGAGGDWAGHAGDIAMRQLGQWLYAPVRDGMRVLDRARGQVLHRQAGAWRAPTRPALPSGGTTVDAEARATLAALIAALQQWGMFPA